MENEKYVHILGIAPYEAMKRSMLKIAEAYPSINIDVYIGDLDEGARLVKQYVDNDYDCIVSRGGTSEHIRKITDIPVIDIEISVYDVLRSFQLANYYTKRYAVVGFPSITKPAHTLCNLLQYDIEIITIHNLEDAQIALQKLQSTGYSAVVCDMIVRTFARKLNLDAFLITSGTESLHIAFDQAITLGSIVQKLRLEKQILSNVLENEEHNFIIFNDEHKIIYSTLSTVKKTLLNLLHNKLQQVTEEKGNKFYFNDLDNLYIITGRTLNFNHNQFVFFRIQESYISLKSNRNGLRFYDRSECEQLFKNSFYNISGAMGELEHQVNSLAILNQPILIMGELGTGKEQIAHILYLRGQLSQKPLIVINCEQIDERTWSWLLSSSNSPLADQGNTVYFQYFETLHIKQVQELCTLIRETALERRVRLLFSCTCMEERNISEAAQILLQTINCLNICLPSLRQRSDEIPSLASLYISNLNSKTELNKQISGFEPDAIKLMQNFPWYNNYIQFRQVLDELASLSDSAYIKANITSKILEKQRSFYRNSFFFNQESGEKQPLTLSEIIQLEIQKRLVENNGNQSATARQLDISRTTLWRYLKNSEEDTII